MKNPFLIGERVYLRPLERGDAASFVPWVNDGDVRRTLLFHRPLNLAQEEEFIDRVSQGQQDVVFGIALKKDDRLIGNIALHRVQSRNRSAGFGIMIGDKTEWNKGYATEATRLIVAYGFRTLNLNRIWLHVYEDNHGGKRAYEKVGFLVEGTLRQDNYREGRYWDTIVMGILREEWERADAAGAKRATGGKRAGTGGTRRAAAGTRRGAAGATKRPARTTKG
jgi:RimJ/RimL family protein N-acetyltransferase